MGISNKIFGLKFRQMLTEKMTLLPRQKRFVNTVPANQNRFGDILPCYGDICNGCGYNAYCRRNIIDIVTLTLTLVC